jgi:hypothetical protein
MPTRIEFRKKNFDAAPKTEPNQDHPNSRRRTATNTGEWLLIASRIRATAGGTNSSRSST